MPQLYYFVRLVEVLACIGAVRTYRASTRSAASYPIKVATDDAPPPTATSAFGASLPCGWPISTCRSWPRPTARAARPIGLSGELRRHALCALRPGVRDGSEEIPGRRARRYRPLWSEEIAAVPADESSTQCAFPSTSHGRFDFDRPPDIRIPMSAHAPARAGQRISPGASTGLVKRSDCSTVTATQVTTFSCAAARPCPEIVFTGLYDDSGSEQCLALTPRCRRCRAVLLRNSALPATMPLRSAIEGLPKSRRCREGASPFCMRYERSASWVPTNRRLDGGYDGSRVAGARRRRRPGRCHVFIALCRRLGVPAR